jgi:hypothetical protein
VQRNLYYEQGGEARIWNSLLNLRPIRAAVGGLGLQITLKLIHVEYGEVRDEAIR